MDDIDIENEIYERLYEKNAATRQEILRKQDEIIARFRRLTHERPSHLTEDA